MHTGRASKAVLALLLGTASVWAYTADEPSTDLDQGWSTQQKTQWYTLSQGSRLLPLAWMKALEQPDAPLPFLLRSYTERFRYLPGDSADPAPLPIGFAVDVQSDEHFSEITRLRWKSGQSDREPWVGMNCAACHTNEMRYQSRRMRIEGAPTVADFQGYMKSLNQALLATRDQPAKWNSFAAKVLAGADTAGNRDMLKRALDRMVDWQLQVEDANATDLQYGFARLDAFGHIFNKVLLRTGGSGQPRNPSDAPVSYPFLWNIHQHDKVQWNGIAPNVPLDPSFDIGALGRNVGEVTGVFADLTLRSPGLETARRGYPTSARLDHLITLENQIGALKPPAWPAALPPIDAERWDAGRKLFNKDDSCVRCHAVLPRKDLSTPIKAQMALLSGAEPIGTDPWMACNAYTYRAATGRLKWTPEKFFVFAGRPYGDRAAVSDLLGTAVIGSIYNQRDQLLRPVIELPAKLAKAKFFERPNPLSGTELQFASLMLASAPLPPSGKEARLQQCMSESSNLLAYKGRPLGGVWATAPYLHNGSVPTLYDLLLPPSQRPQSFVLGTREFDPQKVGYVYQGSAPPYLSEQALKDSPFEFRVKDGLGRTIAGNSNAGHDYGNAQLSDAERWALVEYLKAVGGTRVGDRIIP